MAGGPHEARTRHPAAPNLNALPVAAALIDADGILIKANRRFLLLCGQRSQASLGLPRPISDLIPEPGIAETMQAASRSRAKAHNKEIRAHIRRDSGELRAVGLLLSRVSQMGRPAILGCFQDRTELENLENQLYAISEGSIQGILVHRDMRPLYVNDKYATMYGFESSKDILSMKSILSFTSPEDRSLVWQYYQNRMRNEPAPVRYEHKARTRDGEEIWVDNFVNKIEWEGAPAVLVTNIDTTLVHNHQDSLRRYQHESVSLFAAGIVRSFREYFDEIDRNLSEARVEAYMAKSGRVAEVLQKSNRLIDSARQEIQFVMQLATLGDPVKHRASVCELIYGSILRAEQHAIAMGKGDAVSFNSWVDRDVKHAYFDPSQISKAVLEILKNAVEATEEQGSVQVSVDRFRNGGQSKIEGLQTGYFVRIAVDDEGPGISEDAMQNANAIYSGEPPGRKGWGLSMAAGILHAHQGQLTFERRRTGGTRVTMFVPLIQES